MNKNDLIDTVVEEHDVTRTFARDLVDTVFGSITEAARTGDEVSIFGFGKFRVAERGARKGRNPKTGETIKITASKRLKFEPASAVKKALNTKRRSRKKARARVTPALARVDPPEQALPPVRRIRTVIRNPIEAWPKAVYEQPVFRSPLFGRETVFITDPDLIQEVLVEKADAFVKAESLRRALRPALGDGILTADGARWRWQRRATAPIFRHERIRSFLPAMIQAAERTRDRWLAQPPGSEIDVAHETSFATLHSTLTRSSSSKSGRAASVS